jgi:Tfp pilus assembly protein PilZ
MYEHTIDVVRIKVEQQSDGAWRVLTSRNNNGWWGIGIDFPTEDAAEQVANAIERAVPEQVAW